MNNVFKIDKKNNYKTQFLILVFFVSSIAFAQKSSFETSSCEVSVNQNATGIDTPPVRVSNTELNSNMNFILWFMGTKEDINCTKSNDTFYTKKSIITSGREPNHLLLKTLLKKAINVESV